MTSSISPSSPSSAGVEAGTKRGRTRGAGSNRGGHRRRPAGLLRHEVHQLAAEQPDDQARGGRDADPAAVHATDRQVALRSFRETNHLRGLAEVGEAIENLVALRFEGALVEMRVGLRACSGTVFLEGRRVVGPCSLMSRRLMPYLPTLRVTFATP